MKYTREEFGKITIEETAPNHLFKDIIKTTTNKHFQLGEISIRKDNQEINSVPNLYLEYREGIDLMSTLSEDLGIETIEIVSEDEVTLISPQLGYQAVIETLPNYTAVHIVNLSDDFDYDMFKYDRKFKFVKESNTVHNKTLLQMQGRVIQYIEQYM